MRPRSGHSRFLFLIVGLAFIFLLGMGAERVITPAEGPLSNSFFPQANAQGQPPGTDIPSIVEKAVPAVVNIFTKTVTDMTQGNPWLQDPNFRRFFGIPREQVQNVSGSGVIVSEDGYILTNNHLVRDAKDVYVVLPPPDSRKFTAKIVGTDTTTDVAVLKIEAKNLPVLKLGRSAELRLGETVVAIGYPFQVGQTVTMGIVSGLSKAVPERDMNVELIQTDAAINPGNSGGALINTRGELVGINNMIYSNTGSFAGIGFAVPIDVAKAIMDDIVAHGRFVRGYLGIQMDKLTSDKAEFFGVKQREGVIITKVENGSPASKAGIQADDIVTSMNGKYVKDPGELWRDVSMLHPGDKAAFGILRGGNSTVVTATVGKRPGEKAPGEKNEEEKGKPELALLAGVGLTDLNEEYRQKLQLPDEISGILVTEVDNGSPADEAGLGSGDVIIKFNRKPVANLAGFKALVKGMKGDKFMLTIYRGGGIANIVLQP
ncbi:MAG: Do family serine endopeptidase [Candidatus Krumholzibacteriaceae bacterium]|jgi:Do/DeqQ family serine protease